MYQVIVIGAGPAGMTAAIYSVRKGLKVLVIGKDVGGQVAKSGEIENYLGYGQTTGGELALKFHDHVKKFENLDHKHDIEVMSITLQDKGFAVKTNKAIYKTQSVIITSGRKPRHLNVPGEKEFTNKGVSYCDVCDGPLFKEKSVAIVGGGNSALEAIISLTGIVSYVSVLNINKDFTGDEILRKKVNSLKKVSILHETKAKEITGEKFVTGLTYEDKKGKEHELKVEGVFIEIGYIPSISFDNVTEKDEHNQIKIDINCHTSVKGIFAAGDVTNIRDNQIVIAAGEGAKAALSAYNYITHLDAR